MISINAADRRRGDPSWLWDVPFERLAGRRWWPPAIGAATCRCACTTPSVPHVMEGDPLAAVRIAHGDHDHGDDEAPVDVIGNYTAFAELLRASELPRGGS